MFYSDYMLTLFEQNPSIYRFLLQLIASPVQVDCAPVQPGR